MKHPVFVMAFVVLGAADLALSQSAAEGITPRIASDFEIAQMERQVARSRDFVSQLSARLNLGDLRMTRNERSLAAAEYERALTAATRERTTARQQSDMTRYSTATSYAALAQAKLRRETIAFELLEEAMRYSSDSAKSWNLYSTAMATLRQPRKAASAGRNAVAIATRDLQSDASLDHRLDLAVYQYSLASSLISLGQSKDAEALLVELVAALRTREFDPLRRAVAVGETFEIYSTARGDASAYLSLLNRAQLRLASLYERSGNIDKARTQYERVLADRNDDPTALASLARLARSPEEREQYFAEAFDANPFSMNLVREYQRYLAGPNGGAANDAAGSGSAGSKMRLGLQQAQRGDQRAARATIDELIQDFPSNDTLRALRAELDARSATLPRVLTGDATSPTEDELRQIIVLSGDDRLTAEQRAALDRAQLTSIAVFVENADETAPDRTVFESGTIEGVPFRFSEPTVFAGTFAAGTPLRLTYRILGATQIEGRDALLLEPLRLEPAP